MLKKRILPLLWLITMFTIFIVTLVSHKPYFIMGGSTSVAPLMQTLIKVYPDNHKEADFTYNSLGSDAAIIPVNKSMFGIGWLSKQYKNTNDNLISFVLSKDGMILVYNLPSDCLGNNKPLNFTQTKIKRMYKNEPILWSQLFSEKSAQPNEGWVKPTCNLKVFPYTRENGSGTRDVFNEKVLENPQAYYPQAITVNSSTQMFSMSAGGVGYSSYSDKKQLTSNPKQFRDIHIANWEHIVPSLDSIKNNSYHLARPFTGLINKNFKQINTLVKFLKFLFIPDYPGHNKYVIPAFSEDQYAQAAVSLDDPLNNNLKQWLNKFP